MNEIERAIEHIADNVRFLQTHDYADNSLQAHELALTALKEKLEREKNEPPKCYECKNESDSWECERCIWGDKTDRYEPKGEPNV